MLIEKKSKPPSEHFDFSPVFEDLVDGSIKQLIGFQEIEVPQEASGQTLGKIRLRGRFFKSECAEFRSVLITGPKINIVNMFLFPNSESLNPVYAMEYVMFGKKPVVAVVDIAASPVATENGSAILSAAKSAFPDLRQGDDPPEWFIECRSGNDFFIRPETEQGMLKMCHVHTMVFQQLIHSFRIRRESPRSHELKLHREWSHSYKDHHRVNSPGLPFLNRTFGPEWTDWFLRNFLFA